jgi:hypothetical protein
MQLLNESQIIDHWAPIIEGKTGITERSKVQWISKLCHYHSINESAGAYQSLGVVNGMSSIATPGNIGVNGGPAGFYAGGSYAGTGLGSGDKFPSLLPLAIQVAAKTIGFDIVPVIPMSGPTGVLSYLDYVYSGGKLSGSATDAGSNNTVNSPELIKVPVAMTSPSGALVVGSYYTNAPGAGGTIVLRFVGNSRIDGFPIFQVTSLTATVSIATAITASTDLYLTTSPQTATNNTGTGSVIVYSNGSATLVKTLEDHVQGFSGAGLTGNNALQGPYVDGTKPYDPMERGTGESTYYKSLGLSTFTKFVEAGTFQVAASVTTEQIQDLNRQFGIDVVSMIENALVNEVSQAINKYILSRAFALGWSNHLEFNTTEGSNLNLNVVQSGTAGTTAAYLTKNNGNVSLAYPAGPTTTFENQSTLQRRLFSRILAAANVVANRGRRGPANFVVTNSQVASAIQDISQFTFAPFNNTLTQNNGTLYPVGSLAGMTVYVDQNMSYSDTRILVGRKGADDEPGLKFMPYMMAESIQTISEGTMSPKIAVKSRFSLVEAGHHPQTMYFTFYVYTGNSIS